MEAAHKHTKALWLSENMQLTINPHLNTDQYPLPEPADFMASVTGGKQFTNLDLRAAYQQMPLDSESAKLVTINTHQGFTKFLSSAPKSYRWHSAGDDTAISMTSW